MKPDTRRRFGKLDIPPDVAVEIVSAGESVGEMMCRCVGYAGVGIPISLVVDPTDEMVYDIHPGEPLRVLRGDDPIDLAPVLPEFGATVQGLFNSIVDDWLVEDDEPAEAQATSPEQPPAE
ncbi:MAG: Uma2 family endonuclease [Chloroflexi bacterium]|nr:Uma2 family endonuclease [Chloroflexota bacterium]